MKFKMDIFFACSMSEGEAEFPEEDESSSEESNDDDDQIELTPEESLSAAQERAELAEKEIAYRDAEIQNVRKRMAAEKSDAVQYASMGLARRMLAVLDDIDRAIAMIPENEEGSASESLKLLRNRMWQELAAAGVSKIATDVEFDPNHHEAITTIPATDELPAQTIVSVLESGYRYKNRIIRAARVVVATLNDSEE